MTMHNPHSFVKYCEPSNNLVSEILTEIKEKFTPNEKEIVLDIGCGPGINTNNTLRKFIPAGSHITGGDLSKEMIAFAKQHNTNPDTTFRILDITDGDLWKTWDKEAFTKIFSIFTMHRIKNLRKAYENIYNLLKPDGELICVTPTTDSTEIILPNLAKLPKYSQYSQQILKLKLLINTSDNYNNETYNLLKSIGFEIKVFKTAKKIFSTFNVDELVELYGLVSYLSHVLPDNLFKEILVDAKKTILENPQLVEETDEGYLQKYDFLIIVAKKKIK